MKAKLLAAVLAIGTSQAAIAHSNYNGWAVGASVGWIGSSLKNNNADSAYNKKMKYNQTGFGIHGDWYKSMPNHLLTGFGVGIGYHAGNPSEEVVKQTTKIKISQQRRFYIEGVARIGWSFGNSALYALAAVKGTQIEHKAEMLNTSNNVKKSRFNWGIAPGLGADFKINKNWSLGAEYRYFFEQTENLNSDVKAIKSDLKDMRSHDLRARVSYHF